MKVNGAGEGRRPDAVTGGQSARTPGAGSAEIPRTDEVKVSDLSGALAQLGVRLATDGEFDQSRVDRITAAIANGDYHVNTGAVADKLIRDVRELLAAKPRTS